MHCDRDMRSAYFLEIARKMATCRFNDSFRVPAADRARGGKNSAKQQRRDSSGRFAGAVKHGGHGAESGRAAAASASAKSHSGSAHRAGNGRGRFEAAARTGSATGLQEPDDESAEKHGRSGVMWVEREERILQEM